MKAMYSPQRQAFSELGSVTTTRLCSLLLLSSFQIPEVYLTLKAIPISLLSILIYFTCGLVGLTFN
jgi:hypothetical protein